MNITLKEAARIAGVSVARVYQWRAFRDFPPTIGRRAFSVGAHSVGLHVVTPRHYAAEIDRATFCKWLAAYQKMKGRTP